MIIDPLLVKPIAAQTVKTGVAFIQRLTDELALVAYGGTCACLCVLVQPDGQPRFTVVYPLYFNNRSKFERCLLRRLKAEMTPMGNEGDTFTPLDGTIELCATYVVDSLDCIKRETRLAARCIRDTASPEAEAALESHQEQTRRILESVVVNPGDIVKLNVLYQCNLGDAPPRRLQGDFRMCIQGEIVFPSVLVDGKSDLFETKIRTDIDLVKNVSELRPIGEKFSPDDLPTIEEALRGA